MAPEAFAALHGGYGLEMTPLGYLFRVLLHLLAVGAIAILAFWGSSAAEAVRSAFVAERDDEGTPRDEKTER